MSKRKTSNAASSRQNSAQATAAAAAGSVPYQTRSTNGYPKLPSSTAVSPASTSSTGIASASPHMLPLPLAAGSQDNTASQFPAMSARSRSPYFLFSAGPAGKAQPGADKSDSIPNLQISDSPRPRPQSKRMRNSMPQIFLGTLEAHSSKIISLPNEPGFNN